MVAALLALSLLAPPAQLPRSRDWHVGSARFVAGCGRCVQTGS